MNRTGPFIACACVALIATAAIFGTVFIRNFLHARAQMDVTHLNQQQTNVTQFPIVHAHSLVGRNGEPKIILLHRSTRQPSVVPFFWVDLIAIDPPDKFLRCIVNGKSVEMESDIQVFYVVDDSDPVAMRYSSDTIVPGTAEAKWDAFAATMPNSIPPGSQGIQNGG